MKCELHQVLGRTSTFAPASSSSTGPDGSGDNVQRGAVHAAYPFGRRAWRGDVGPVEPAETSALRAAPPPPRAAALS